MYDRLMVGLSIQFRCMIKVFYDEGHSACNISCTCTVSETCTSKNPLFPTPNPRRCENDQRNVPKGWLEERYSAARNSPA